LSRGCPTEILADAEAAAERLKPLMNAGDLLLIKGSRLMKLERIYELLKG
jgi:UDP-N-acetylmuramyl pentapeptide synthase